MHKDIEENKNATSKLRKKTGRKRMKEKKGTKNPSQTVFAKYILNNKHDSYE